MPRDIHLPMGFDAGSGGIMPASSIVIQNCQTSQLSRFSTYGSRCDNLVCGLIGGATIANRGGSETPFVHGRMKTPNTSPQAIQLNPRCFGQAHSKGPRTGPGNENMEYRLAFRILRAPSIICHWLHGCL